MSVCGASESFFHYKKWAVNQVEATRQGVNHLQNVVSFQITLAVLDKSQMYPKQISGSAGKSKQHF